MGGELVRSPEEANRLQFYSDLIGLMTRATYRGDGHYLDRATPSFGNFTVNDYLVFELQQAAGQLPSEALRRELLDTGRPCIQVSSADSPAHWFILVHPEDLRPEGMLSRQFGHLLDMTGTSNAPSIIHAYGEGEGSQLTVELIQDPFQNPILLEVHSALMPGQGAH